MTHEFLLGGDLRIRRLGFGAMRLPTGGWHGPPRDPKTGRAVLRRAIELGVNHIDTSDYYRSNDGSVRANVLIREALHPYPRGLVLATKIGPVFGPKRATEAGPAELRALVEGNLETLGLDRLDLVYLRIGSGLEVPHGSSLGERFEALARLREEGLIRHLALSNVDAAHLAEARAIAPVTAVQNHFNLAERQDTALLETCARSEIAFVPFGPIGSGHTQFDDPRIAKIAARHAATVSQIALAWILAASPVTLAIPGTGSIAHLEENMRAGSIALSAAELAELAQIDRASRS
jgi:pyridoxine 4-dehydrogenase